MTAVSTSSQRLAAGRAQGRHTSMFLRMLSRSAVLRRGRAVAALLAMMVAAAVATAVLNLYVDAQAKLRSEFRNYGANIIVVGKDNASLPSDALTKIEARLNGRGLAAPFALVVARTRGGQPIVIAGTDFDRVRRLDRWWSVSGWPAVPQQALIGARAVSTVSPHLQPFDLNFAGRTLHLTPVGTLQTGGPEDDRLYISLADFASWTGVQPSTIEVAVSGPPSEVEAVMRELVQVLPSAEVRPVRQIMEGEVRVLGKTRATMFAASALIVFTSALCVLSTLMGWVFDRRKDFAMMRALGASAKLLTGFFAAEAAILGAIGAVLGFILGIGIAEWVARVNFHASVEPRFSVLPLVMAASIAVTLLAAILPISQLRRVQPAVILRGE